MKLVYSGFQHAITDMILSDFFYHSDNCQNSLKAMTLVFCDTEHYCCYPKRSSPTEPWDTTF